MSAVRLTTVTFPEWLTDQARELNDANTQLAALRRHRADVEGAGGELSFLELAEYRKAERLVWEAEARMAMGDLITSVIGLTETAGTIEVRTKDRILEMRVDWQASA